MEYMGKRSVYHLPEKEEEDAVIEMAFYISGLDVCCYLEQQHTHTRSVWDPTYLITRNP